RKTREGKRELDPLRKEAEELKQSDIAACQSDSTPPLETHAQNSDASPLQVRVESTTSTDTVGDCEKHMFDDEGYENDDDDQTLVGDDDERDLEPSCEVDRVASQCGHKNASLALRGGLDRLRREKRALLRQWRRSAPGVSRPQEIGTTSDAAAAAQGMIATFQQVMIRTTGLMSELDETHRLRSSQCPAAERQSQVAESMSQCLLKAWQRMQGLNGSSELADWKQVLEAIIIDVDRLAHELQTARNSALAVSPQPDPRQLVASLHQSEVQREPPEDVEATSHGTTRDMADRLQTLQSQLETLQSDNTRLNKMTTIYEEQIKLLQHMNNTMEEQSLIALEKLECMGRAGDRIAHVADTAQGKLRLLESQLATQHQEREAAALLLAERDATIAGLEERMAELVQEKEAIAAELQRSKNEQAEDHEREVGILHSRVDTLVAQLDQAQASVNALRCERDRTITNLNAVEHGATARIDIEALHAMTQLVAAQVSSWRNRVRDGEQAAADNQGTQVRTSVSAPSAADYYEPATPAMTARTLRSC
ncbi:hypothetical protein KEM52_002468, partial [Ascosphaera acerosa]